MDDTGEKLSETSDPAVDLSGSLSEASQSDLLDVFKDAYSLTHIRYSDDAWTSYDKNIQPDDTDIQPDDTNIQPDDTNVQPDDANVQPDDTDFQPHDTNIQPDDTNVQPDDMNVQVDDTNVQPDDTNIQPDDMNIQPDNTNVQPDDMNVQLDDTNVQLDDTNIQPDDMNIQPDNTNVQPDDMNVQLDDTNVQLDDTNIQPDDMNIQPDDTNVQPDDMNVQVDDTNVQPDDTNIQPDDMNIQPDNTNVQPDDMNVQLDDTNVQLDDTNIQPDDMNIQPDDTNVQPDDMNVQVDDTNVQPDDMNIQPDDMNIQPDNTNVQPDDMNVQLDDTNVQLDDTNIQPDDMNIQPDDMNVQLDDTNVQLDDTNIQPDDMNIQPDDTNVQPDDMNVQVDDTNVQPDDMNIQPDDMNIQPDNTNVQPDDMNVQLDDTNVQLDDTNIQPDDMNIQPDDTNVQPDDTNIQPDDTDIQPDDTNIQPDDTNIQPDDMNIQPDDTNVQPDDTNIQPDDTDIQPDDTNIQPDDTNVQPDDTNVQPDDTNVQPDDINVQPDDTNVQPDDMNIQPDDTNVQPDDTNVQPDDINVQPDDTNVQPDDMNIQPDDTNVQPDDTNIQPYDMNVQPDDTNVQPVNRQRSVPNALTPFPVRRVSSLPNVLRPKEYAPGLRCCKSGGNISLLVVTPFDFSQSVGSSNRPKKALVSGESDHLNRSSCKVGPGISLVDGRGPRPQIRTEDSDESQETNVETVDMCEPSNEQPMEDATEVAEITVLEGNEPVKQENDEKDRRISSVLPCDQRRRSVSDATSLKSLSHMGAEDLRKTRSYTSFPHIKKRAELGENIATPVAHRTSSFRLMPHLSEDLFPDLDFPTVSVLALCAREEAYPPEVALESGSESELSERDSRPTDENVLHSWRRSTGRKRSISAPVTMETVTRPRTWSLPSGDENSWFPNETIYRVTSPPSRLQLPNQRLDKLKEEANLSSRGESSESIRSRCSSVMSAVEDCDGVTLDRRNSSEEVTDHWSSRERCRSVAESPSFSVAMPIKEIDEANDEDREAGPEDVTSHSSMEKTPSAMSLVNQVAKQVLSSHEINVSPESAGEEESTLVESAVKLWKAKLTGRRATLASHSPLTDSPKYASEIEQEAFRKIKKWKANFAVKLDNVLGQRYQEMVEKKEEPGTKRKPKVMNVPMNLSQEEMHQMKSNLILELKRKSSGLGEGEQLLPPSPRPSIPRVRFPRRASADQSPGDLRAQMMKELSGRVSSIHDHDSIQCMKPSAVVPDLLMGPRRSSHGSVPYIARGLGGKMLDPESVRDLLSWHEAERDRLRAELEGLPQAAGGQQVLIDRDDANKVLQSMMKIMEDIFMGTMKRFMGSTGSETNITGEKKVPTSEEGEKKVRKRSAKDNTRDSNTRKPLKVHDKGSNSDVKLDEGFKAGRRSSFLSYEKPKNSEDTLSLVSSSSEHLSGESTAELATSESSLTGISFSSSSDAAFDACDELDNAPANSEAEVDVADLSVNNRVSSPSLPLEDDVDLISNKSVKGSDSEESFAPSLDSEGKIDVVDQDLPIQVDSIELAFPLEDNEEVVRTNSFSMTSVILPPELRQNSRGESKEAVVDPTTELDFAKTRVNTILQEATTRDEERVDASFENPDKVNASPMEHQNQTRILPGAAQGKVESDSALSRRLLTLQNELMSTVDNADYWLNQCVERREKVEELLVKVKTVDSANFHLRRDVIGKSGIIFEKDSQIKRLVQSKDRSEALVQELRDKLSKASEENSRLQRMLSEYDGKKKLSLSQEGEAGKKTPSTSSSMEKGFVDSTVRSELETTGLEGDTSLHVPDESKVDNGPTCTPEESELSNEGSSSVGQSCEDYSPCDADLPNTNDEETSAEGSLESKAKIYVDDLIAKVKEGVLKQPIDESLSSSENFPSMLRHHKEEQWSRSKRASVRKWLYELIGRAKSELTWDNMKLSPSEDNEDEERLPSLDHRSSAGDSMTDREEEKGEKDAKVTIKEGSSSPEETNTNDFQPIPRTDRQIIPNTFLQKSVLSPLSAHGQKNYVAASTVVPNGEPHLPELEDNGSSTATRFKDYCSTFNEEELTNSIPLPNRRDETMIKLFGDVLTPRCQVSGDIKVNESFSDLFLADFKYSHVPFKEDVDVVEPFGEVFTPGLYPTKSGQASTSLKAEVKRFALMELSKPAFTTVQESTSKGQFDVVPAFELTADKLQETSMGTKTASLFAGSKKADKPVALRIGKYGVLNKEVANRKDLTSIGKRSPVDVALKNIPMERKAVSVRNKETQTTTVNTHTSSANSPEPTNDVSKTYKQGNVDSVSLRMNDHGRHFENRFVNKNDLKKKWQTEDRQPAEERNALKPYGHVERYKKQSFDDFESKRLAEIATALQEKPESSQKDPKQARLCSEKVNLQPYSQGSIDSISVEIKLLMSELENKRILNSQESGQNAIDTNVSDTKEGDHMRDRSRQVTLERSGHQENKQLALSGFRSDTVAAKLSPKEGNKVSSGPRFSSTSKDESAAAFQNGHGHCAEMARHRKYDVTERMYDELACIGGTRNGRDSITATNTEIARNRKDNVTERKKDKLADINGIRNERDIVTARNNRITDEICNGVLHRDGPTNATKGSTKSKKSKLPITSPGEVLSWINKQIKATQKSKSMQIKDKQRPQEELRRYLVKDGMGIQTSEEKARKVSFDQGTYLGKADRGITRESWQTREGRSSVVLEDKLKGIITEKKQKRKEGDTAKTGEKRKRTDSDGSAVDVEHSRRSRQRRVSFAEDTQDQSCETSKISKISYPPEKHWSADVFSVSRDDDVDFNESDLSVDSLCDLLASNDGSFDDNEFDNLLNMYMSTQDVLRRHEQQGEAIRKCKQHVHFMAEEVESLQGRNADISTTSNHPTSGRPTSGHPASGYPTSGYPTSCQDTRMKAGFSTSMATNPPRTTSL